MSRLILERSRTFQIFFFFFRSLNRAFCLTGSPEVKENGQKVLSMWERLPEKQPLRLGVKRLRDARAHRAVIEATLAGPLLSTSFLIYRTVWVCLTLFQSLNNSRLDLSFVGLRTRSFSSRRLYRTEDDSAKLKLFLDHLKGDFYWRNV